MGELKNKRTKKKEKKKKTVEQNKTKQNDSNNKKKKLGTITTFFVYLKESSDDQNVNITIVNAMKRKSQNKCYHTRAVTLIIVFKNIYQIFCPVTLLKHMLITNQ